jgi:hypothetical protein
MYVIPLGGSALAAPASSVSDSTSITSNYAFVTLHGARWRLWLTIEAVGKTDNLKFSLSRKGTTGLETHTWVLPRLPRSSLKAPATGAWTIAPPTTSTSPLVSINLTFTSRHQGASSCSSGSGTRYIGTLTGSFELNTGFAHLGQVGSKTINFGTHSQAIRDLGCVVAQPTCPVQGYSWTAASSGWLFGFANSNGDSFAVLTTTALSAPKGAERYDGAASLEPKARVSGNNFEIFTSSKTQLSGKGTLTMSGEPVTHSSTCWTKGVQHTLSTTAWTSTRFSGSPIVGATEFTGKISSGTKGTGTIGRVTVH